MIFLLFQNVCEKGSEKSGSFFCLTFGIDFLYNYPILAIMRNYYVKICKE